MMAAVRKQRHVLLNLQKLLKRSCPNGTPLNRALFQEEVASPLAIHIGREEADLGSDREQWEGGSCEAPFLRSANCRTVKEEQSYSFRSPEIDTQTLQYHVRTKTLTPETFGIRVAPAYVSHNCFSSQNTNSSTRISSQSSNEPTNSRICLGRQNPALFLDTQNSPTPPDRTHNLFAGRCLVGSANHRLLAGKLHSLVQGSVGAYHISTADSKGTFPTHSLSAGCPRAALHTLSTGTCPTQSLLAGGARVFSAEPEADVSDAALVEHLDSDSSDHPTDADLDRVMGEPTSSVSVADAGKETPPKVSIEATKLFNRVWSQVVIKMGGIESLNIPKEIVWLNGAPGSGKGANTPFILQTRGFPTKAISISNLLQDDKQAREIMNSGALLSDSHVLELVLEGILRMGFVDSPDEEGDEIPDEDEIIAGVVVDGFPRTTMQVDFVKLLHDKLADLHYQHLGTPQEHHFPRPIFRIAVLYVEEEESVRRQLHRGKAALTHNQRVKESGLGDLVEVRETDLDEKAARRRYQIFREHYDTLLRLKSFFPFHLIDAMGTLAQCREQIADELQYQSGLELGEDTFRAICHLPLAKNLVKQARQNMVTRLDSYMKHDLDVFKKVIDIVEHEVIPIVRKCALAGVALYNTEKELFFARPESAEMLADVLSERGYYVTWQTRWREIPIKVDLTTGAISCERRVSLQFRIKFDRPIIRNPTLYPAADEKA